MVKGKGTLEFSSHSRLLFKAVVISWDCWRVAWISLWLFGHMYPLALIKSSIRIEGFLVLDPKGHSREVNR